MKSILIAALVISMPSVVGAIDSSRVMLGLGTDLSNYLLDGYSIETSLSFDQIEIGLAYCTFKLKSWIHSDDVTGGDVKETAILVKYNFGKNITKPFIGGGILYLDESYDYPTGEKDVGFRNTYIFGSVGYNVRVSDHFRLIPSLQAGFIVAGDTKKTINNVIYSVGKFAGGARMGAFYFF